ncbi:MAG: YraN family protein, partial [Planctomycetota bacterium]
PFEKVNAEKQRQVIRVAQVFRKHHHLMEVPCRFDVVGVWLDAGDHVERVEILRGAFEAPG